MIGKVFVVLGDWRRHLECVDMSYFVTLEEADETRNTS